MDSQRGMLGPEVPQCLSVVLYCGGVDHAEPQPAMVPRARALSPVRQIGGERHHLAGVLQDRLGVWSQHPAPAVPVEQRHTDTAFELGQTLRQSRRAHTDPFGGQRERV